MAAYIFAEIEITDPEGYTEYTKGVPASIAAYGGRFLARGGATEMLEGDGARKRVVIIEFPSMEQLKAWYGSPDYQRLLTIRKNCSTGRLMAIQGVSSPTP